MGFSDGTEAQTRGRANPKPKPDQHSNGDRRARRASSHAGTGQQINVDHQNRTKGNSDHFHKVITGGMLTQLIKSVQDQLEDAEASVDWYERKKKDYQAQLEALQSLAAMIEEADQESLEE